MKRRSFLSILLILSLILIFVGGIVGYSMMLQGVKLRYSGLESYDGTQIAIIIAEPDDVNNRFGEEKYGIVIAHGIISKAESNLRLIIELARAGFTVVALDERGHGNSGGAITGLSVGEKEYQDVIRCAEFLQDEMGCSKISLAGHSLGGVAVTRASVYAEYYGINISGTIGMSVPMAASMSEQTGGELAFFVNFFYNTFYVNMSIIPFADEINETAAPYNFLTVISEGDDLINVPESQYLCNLTGGPGKTSAADFAIGNASDIFVIPKSEAAPDHGGTPKDPRTIQKIITWVENSVGIIDHYTLSIESNDLYWKTQNDAFGFAFLGFTIILLPLYVGVKNKILIYNKSSKEREINFQEEIATDSKSRETRDVGIKDVFILFGITTGAIFVAPLLVNLITIPLLQTYVAFNVFIRSLIIAMPIVLLLIFILKYEEPKDIFNKENVRRFLISAIAAGVMLFVYLLGMNLIDTYYSVNMKWMPFTFNPFILERFLMFLIFLIEILFVMGLVEYICRKQVQDNLFGAKDRFTIRIWIKTALFNGFIKGVLITILVIGIFFANDLENMMILFTPQLLSLWTFLIAAIIAFSFIDGIMTLFYQHSKDFWFVNIACYTYVAWYIASWLIRV